MVKRRRNNKRRKQRGNFALIRIMVVAVTFMLLFTISLKSINSCNTSDKVCDSTYDIINSCNCVFQDSVINTVVVETICDTVPEEKFDTVSLIIDKLEHPKIYDGIPDYIISHKAYTLSFNKSTHCPNWVAWRLTSEMTNGRWGRSDDYRADDKVISYDDRVDAKTYTGEGYDRGHMCPAGDMGWDKTAMSESFLMTNMCPQENYLNNGGWRKLEEACRRWAQQEGIIYICCGPIFKGDEKSVGSRPSVKVPSGFFKVVLSLRAGHEKAIGFYYRNDDSRQIMSDAVRTVDEIEKITGYDFFPLLDDELENRVEVMNRLSKWN